MISHIKVYRQLIIKSKTAPKLILKLSSFGYQAFGRLTMSYSFIIKGSIHHFVVGTIITMIDTAAVMELFHYPWEKST